MYWHFSFGQLLFLRTSLFCLKTGQAIYNTYNTDMQQLYKVRNSILQQGCLWGYLTTLEPPFPKPLSSTRQQAQEEE
jgi:hypothetical protein